MKVGCLQYDIIWHNIDANLNKIELLTEDRLHDIDLLILPEMFQSGFTMNPSVVAETMNGKTVLWMKHFAEKNNLAVTGSIVVQENDMYYNRLIFIKPDGSIVYYNKRHLFRMGHEDDFYTQGDVNIIIDYLGFRIKPLICYDLRFPVWSRNQNNYDLLIYVANWPASRQKAWDLLLSARAVENQCYTIGVNRIGRDKNGFYAGGSKVLNYNGESIVCLQSPSETLINCNIEIHELINYRLNFPAYLDADQFKII
ncbi:MAG: amidohydrolase [Marinilabiliaceae bacterium]|nr:amidohydrolase [Marinilabiliaceae bacterium]